MGTYVTYLRVSTKVQGRSGLGLEAQRKICNDFISASGGKGLCEFVDVESGTHRDRKGLQDAINFCKSNGCELVIAKLDRLARDVEFCFKVVNTGIKIHFCDMPTINTLLLGVFASVAQYERELTSDRTKKALAAKKERGEATGGACKKWRDSYNKKTYKERVEEQMKRGRTKNVRHLESADIKAFIRILRNVFPDATQGDDLTCWCWKDINTKQGNKERVLTMMRDYQEIDTTLFRKWEINDVDDLKLQVKLASYIGSLRKSVLRDHTSKKLEMSNE
jgi:DNA invertase Pin-like site-specific DNA recombinase